MPRYGIIFVLLAALFWGVTGGIAGALIQNGWDSLVVAFYRGAIGLIFVGIWFILKPRNNGFLNPKLWFWAAVAGLGVAGNFSFYFLSIEEGSIAIAATLMYCAPIFVYLISFALRLEKATPFKISGVLLVVIGVALMTEIHNVNAEKLTHVAIGAGLLSGLCYALFIFGFKYAVRLSTPQGVLVIAFSFFSLILLVLSWDIQLLIALYSEQWNIFVFLGVFGAGISFFLYINGLKYTAPAIASIVAIIEPVTASLLGFVVFDERLSHLQFFGMILILFTVTLFSRYSIKSD